MNEQDALVIVLKNQRNFFLDNLAKMEATLMVELEAKAAAEQAAAEQVPKKKV